MQGLGGGGEGGGGSSNLELSLESSLPGYVLWALWSRRRQKRMSVRRKRIRRTPPMEAPMLKPRCSFLARLREGWLDVDGLIVEDEADDVDSEGIAAITVASALS